MMGPGGIATIICAVALLAIAISLAYMGLRVSKFIDEASASLKVLTEDTAPLIQESTRTLELINSPLASFAKITKNVEEVTTKVTETATDFMDKGGPAIKVAGALIAATQANKSRSKKKKKAE